MKDRRIALEQVCPLSSLETSIKAPLLAFMSDGRKLKETNFENLFTFVKHIEAIVT